MNSNAPSSELEGDRERQWRERQQYWQHRLGRLRLGAEPIEDQLQRYRRGTWGLTVVCSAIGLLFIGLFSAFQSPGMGVMVAVVLFGPVILAAWLSFIRLRGKAQRYLREREDYLKRQAEASSRVIRDQAGDISG